MLIAPQRLSWEFAAKLRKWHPSGFQVYCGPPVEWEDKKALERLSAYILRPSFAATRLQYDSENGQIEYRTAKAVRRSLHALDWIALVTSPIPNPHQPMLRYYGRYSNAARGKRRREALGISVTSRVDCTSEPDSPAERFARHRRRHWARLLKKI